MKAAVVGLRMGAYHAKCLASLPDVHLVAVCDLDGALADKVSAQCGASAGAGEPPVPYTDYAAMLREARADIVGIATPNRLHCEMTLAALEAGARAIYCEKPIAVDLGEARRMVDACRAAGVPLIFNHQRRTGPDFAWMREQIEAGTVGEVYLIRGTCAGDMLSDGTHLVDSVLYLTGDAEWDWVFAAHHRTPGGDETGGTDRANGGGYDKVSGWRFGHPVEDGMMAVVEMESGLRVELLTGDLSQPGRPYHDIEVIGTEGSLWRSGDRGEHNLFRRTAGGWESVAGVPSRRDLVREAYARTVELVNEGKPDSEHPMGSPYAMRGFELLMGAYESARTRTIVRRPVAQENYPLAVELGLAGTATTRSAQTCTEQA